MKKGCQQGIIASINVYCYAILVPVHRAHKLSMEYVSVRRNVREYAAALQNGLVANNVKNYCCANLINVRMFATKMPALLVRTQVSRPVYVELRRSKDHAMILYGAARSVVTNHSHVVTINVKKYVIQVIVAIVPTLGCGPVLVELIRDLFSALMSWRPVWGPVGRLRIIVNTLAQRNATKAPVLHAKC